MKKLRKRVRATEKTIEAFWCSCSCSCRPYEDKMDESYDFRHYNTENIY